MFTITIISVLVISLFVWITNHFSPFRICPICAGVSGTWIWILTGHFLGYEVDLIIPALLMGGSVVGISSKLDKIWKIIFILLGFILAYNLLLENWMVLAIFLVVFVLILLVFLASNKEANSNKGVTKELEQKMKNCC